VKELLEQQAQYEEEKKKVTSSELYRRVDADYYGFRDEDDGVLVRVLFRWNLGDQAPASPRSICFSGKDAITRTLH